MPDRTFDAVIFDMDGVLCDSEPFIAAAAAEALRRRYGIIVSREDFLPFVGAGDDRFITGAAELHGVTVDLAIDKPLTYEIYLELIAVSLQPVAGVHAFLAEARAAGLRLAVATGSDRPKLNGNLAAIGVAESTFDVVVSAEHVTRKKPDPETFLRAVEGLGLPAARCLVVEDAATASGPVARRAARCSASRRPSPPRHSSRRGPSLSRPTSRRCRRTFGRPWVCPDQRLPSSSDGASGHHAVRRRTKVAPALTHPGPRHLYLPERPCVAGGVCGRVTRARARMEDDDVARPAPGPPGGFHRPAPAGLRRGLGGGPADTHGAARQGHLLRREPVGSTGTSPAPPATTPPSGSPDRLRHQPARRRVRGIHPRRLRGPQAAQHRVRHHEPVLHLDKTG